MMEYIIERVWSTRIGLEPRVDYVTDYIAKDKAGTIHKGSGLRWAFAVSYDTTKADGSDSSIKPHRFKSLRTARTAANKLSAWWGMDHNVVIVERKKK